MQNFFKLNFTTLRTVMLVISLCWWLNDGDHFKMLVTFQSVTNIIICQNVMLVTDMLCWRHEIQPGAKFNHFFPSLNRSWGTYIGPQHHNTPECDVGDWYLTLVPNSRCWWRDLSPTSKSCHQYIWSPTSVTNIDVNLKFIGMMESRNEEIVKCFGKETKSDLK